MCSQGPRITSKSSAKYHQSHFHQAQLPTDVNDGNLACNYEDESDFAFASVEDEGMAVNVPTIEDDSRKRRHDTRWDAIKEEASSKKG
jgi:hypothetical protein